jgi:hypothetical protein
MAFGREPAFPPRRGQDPSRIPSFQDDEEAWAPYFVEPCNCPVALAGYVFQPALVVVTFRAHARITLVSHGEHDRTPAEVSGRTRPHHRDVRAGDHHDSSQATRVRCPDEAAPGVVVGRLAVSHPVSIRCPHQTVPTAVCLRSQVIILRLTSNGRLTAAEPSQHALPRIMDPAAPAYPDHPDSGTRSR